MRRFARYVAPPILWMSVIFLASTDRGSSANTRPVVASLLRRYLPSVAAQMSPEAVDRVDFTMRKAGHVSEYALLGFLLARAIHFGAPIPLRRRAMWAAWMVATGYAATDEWHQSFVPSRGATPIDVLYDAAGAAMGVMASARRIRRRLARSADAQSS